jgi:hypothetical protein
VRPLHVESRVTNEPDAADAGGGALGRHASSRVVREPGRGVRLAAIVAALGLLAGGATLVVRGTGEQPRPEDDADDPGVAYREAIQRLGHAGSFAYRGSVHAAGPSAMRPGPQGARDVTVEGAVRLPQSITREVAVDDRGGAVETVTSGSAVWSRAAPSVDGLAAAAWEVVAPGHSPDVGSPDRLGAALVADVLRAAGDGQRDGTDAAGRRVIRATVPPDDRDERYGDALDGAAVRVTLSEAGEIAHIVLTSAEERPPLALRLDIVRLGDPAVIAPDDVGAPARSTVVTDGLVAAGVEPLELGELPPGWGLTDVHFSTGLPAGGPMVAVSVGCAALSLDYRDLRAVTEGSLHVTTTSEACVAAAGRVVTGTGGRPLRIGPFAGTVDEEWGRSFGDLSDGTTRVAFSSDLPADELARLVASLRPLDPAGGPAAA